MASGAQLHGLPPCSLSPRGDADRRSRDDAEQQERVQPCPACGFWAPPFPLTASLALRGWSRMSAGGTGGLGCRLFSRWRLVSVGGGIGADRGVWSAGLRGAERGQGAWLGLFQQPVTGARLFRPPFPFGAQGRVQPPRQELTAPEEPARDPSKGGTDSSSMSRRPVLASSALTVPVSCRYGSAGLSHRPAGSSVSSVSLSKGGQGA